ncbi:MAG TPA: hypothetical protein VGR47_22835 [Terracidiphilus sp.]|nr:hypothetical protein [Terracidiphilus sp.]
MELGGSRRPYGTAGLWLARGSRDFIPGYFRFVLPGRVGKRGLQFAIGGFA